MTMKSTYRKQLLAEVEALPPEFLPPLLRMVRAYRESVSLSPATESFARGWREARNGEVSPIAELWEGIDGK